jgi:hypothetical protein
VDFAVSDFSENGFSLIGADGDVILPGLGVIETTQTDRAAVVVRGIKRWGHGRNGGN